MATLFTIKFGKLQGNLNADGYTITNLDLSGLGLTKSSVGLGNVDNTSDLLKPLSTAAIAALATKEPTIAPGTTSQFWRGDKTWQTFGALALLGGETGLPLISTRGAGATSSATLRAERNDFGSSGASIWMEYFGASHAGSVLGLSSANVGLLEFHGAAFGVIKANNAAPLVFGYNNVRRMRLMQGLNVGGDGDPGAGCITCYDTMSTAHLRGGDLVLTVGPGSGSATIGGNATVAGSLSTTLGILVGQNAAVGGNLAVTGVIVNFANLPTSDPLVNGQLWRSTNDVKISTG